MGISFAKGLSYAKNIPIIPVHHIKEHIYANFLEHNIELPCISLVVSDEHTNIIYIDENHNFINIGETLDDAVEIRFLWKPINRPMMTGICGSSAKSSTSPNSIK